MGYGDDSAPLVVGGILGRMHHTNYTVGSYIERTDCNAVTAYMKDREIEN